MYVCVIIAIIIYSLFIIQRVLFIFFYIENLIAKLIIIKKLCIFIRRKEVFKFYTFNVLSRSGLLNLITTTCVGAEERRWGWKGE